MSAYKSFILSESNGILSGEVGLKNIDKLTNGDLLIKVKYSSLNYLDALILSGKRHLTGRLPHTPGVDAAGVVVESTAAEFRPGDEVIVTGFGLGTDVAGGFGEYIRVPASWAVSLPTGLTLKECMTVGSDGLSAALAIMDLMSAGACSKAENVVVSGAGLGIGSFATAILANLGFRVTAVVRDSENSEFTKIIGADEVISCGKFIDTSAGTLLSDKYYMAIDTLGGEVLSTIIRSLKKNGTVAVCSTMLKDDISFSLDALTIRGINILGINSLNCPLTLKKTVWRKLAGEWYLKALPMLCTEISLMELEEYSKRLINGEIKGRLVVNYEL